LHAFKTIFRTDVGGSAQRMGFRLAPREALRVHRVRYTLSIPTAADTMMYLSVTGERVEAPLTAVIDVVQASDVRYPYLVDAFVITSIGFTLNNVGMEFSTNELYGGDLVFGLVTLTSADVFGRVDMEYTIETVSPEVKMKLIQDTGRVAVRT